MNSTIRLFKAVPIITKDKKKASKELLEKTVPYGFIFSPTVIANYPGKKMDELIETVKKEIGLTADQMNSSFHKSWNKVRTTNIEQLVMEQLVHYFTTYGFEDMGIYDKDSVYFPRETLEIPNLEIEGLRLTVIKGYTKKEFKEKLIKLLQTGIALSEDTVKDVVDIALYVELNEEEVTSIRNREAKIALYDYMGIVPEDPVEFLRYVVYKATAKTLLIKDKKTISTIKEQDNKESLVLFVKYKKKYGLERLAEIFYRFKPIFLAFKTHSQLNAIINKTRKLAKKYHQPMKRDYLNEVTAKIKKKDLEVDRFKEMLEKANTFRKVRLAYALKFRTKELSSIVYKVRNGKGYATDFHFENKIMAKKALDIVLDSIAESVKKNVKGKKIYIPEHVNYTLPATEKQFIGALPIGTCITVPSDMIVGVHWKNLKGHRIDLDLSMISAAAGKIGWNARYRTEEGNVLFSGDVTDALGEGASELFYVRRQAKDAYILTVNYYNFDEGVEVPFDVIVAKERVANLIHNYTVNPNNVLSIAKTKINKKQKMLGLLVTTTENCKFYYIETAVGNTIASSDSLHVKQSREYFFDYYTNTIELKEVLEKAGAKLVKEKDKCDIDLSPEVLEKDTIIKLIL